MYDSAEESIVAFVAAGELESWNFQVEKVCQKANDILERIAVLHPEFVASVQQ